MSVRVRSTDPFTFDEPQRLFRIGGQPDNLRWYDVAPDGQKFLVVVPTNPAAGALQVIVNWQELLKQ
jgi:hypothetical protein